MPEAPHPKPRGTGADVAGRSRSYFQDPRENPAVDGQGHAAGPMGQLDLPTNHPAPQSECTQVSAQGSWFHEFEQALQAWNETFIPARG
jgi:hypothetical protein